MRYLNGADKLKSLTRIESFEESQRYKEDVFFFISLAFLK